MGKIFLKFRILEALTGLYECRSYCDLTGEYYPAADYEALEAKLTRLVEVAEAVELNWALVGWGYNLKLRDKLKAAIEAAKVKP